MSRLLLVAMLAVVSVGLGWGFTVVGGPAQARMEQRDIRRASDLRELGQYYRCILSTTTEGISDSAPTPCMGRTQPSERTDPLSGAAYRYTKTSATGFEVCAIFEVEMPHLRRDLLFGVALDGQEGCVRYRRKVDGADWEMD